MEADGTPPSVASTPLRLRPGQATLGVLAGTGLILLFTVQERRVAIGFVVATLLVAVVDAFLSARALTASELRLTPIRSVAASPDRLTFSVTTRPGPLPIILSIDPLSVLDESGVEVTLEADATSTIVEQTDGTPRLLHHVRYRVMASHFGLVWASRWTVQAVPGGLWRAPGPSEPAQLTNVATDETARLREYVPGDRRSRVVWPVTARTGRLHVRTPGIGDAEATVVVDLGRLDEVKTRDDAAVVHDVVQTAADVVSGLLEQGLGVRLVTRRAPESFFRAETARALANPHRSERWLGLRQGPPAPLETGVDSGLVTDEHQLVERLAAADIGDPPPRPPGPHVVVDKHGTTVVS